MRTLLFSFEAIASGVAFYSCPHGISGRIHTLRLRRLFRCTGGHPVSTSSASFVDQVWNSGYDEDNQENDPELQQLSPLLQSRQSRLSDVQARGDISKYSAPAVTDTAIERSSSIPLNQWVKKAGISIEIPSLQTSIRPNDASAGTIDFYDEFLTQAVSSGSPHAILSALTKLVAVNRGRMRENETFRAMSPNAFSEILRCLNPDNFVGRYVDLNQNLIRPRTARHLTYHFEVKKAVHEFRIKFMAIVSLIIQARRSSGFDLSFSDYKTLLSHAVVVENLTASRDIWQLLVKGGFMLDTECFNYYLAGILKVGMSDGVQRSELRTKFTRQFAFGNESEDSLLYHEKLSRGFKNMTSQLFDDMLQRGIAGDEKTFCLLMISSARAGDLDGVKSILDRVWGINVDKLMTINENDLEEPKNYPIDSSFRPTTKLLFALVHCFGINNMVPTALRILDYVSRKYTLSVPIEVWEDLLGLTFTLSAPRTSKKAKGLRLTQLSPEAVSILWSAMTAEPYSVRPTMAMYDRFIVNLLRRQRFGEAIAQVREAEKVQKQICSKFRATSAIDNHLASLMDRKVNHKRPVRTQGLTAYENYLHLKRERIFQSHEQNQNRHYLCRWCRLVLNLAPSSLKENVTFTVVDLPRFIHEHMQYIPRRIQYTIGTGIISFDRDFEGP